MTTYIEFERIEDDCATLISSIDYQIKYASDILGIACRCDQVDDNNIVHSMNKYSEEHLKTLIYLAKQISSKSDKLCSRLNDFKDLVSKLDSTDK